MADGVIGRRKARKKWLQRIADTVRTSDLRCAACDDQAPPAPVDSRYSEPQLLQQIWRCTRCGYQWTTSTKVPA